MGRIWTLKLLRPELIAVLYIRTEAAKSLDINASMLDRWVKEHQADDGQFFGEMASCSPNKKRSGN
jgi:transposase-like protein